MTECQELIDIVMSAELAEYVDQKKIQKTILEPFFSGKREQELSQFIFQLIALQKWIKKI